MLEIARVQCGPEQGAHSDHIFSRFECVPSLKVLQCRSSSSNARSRTRNLTAFAHLHICTFLCYDNLGTEEKTCRQRARCSRRDSLHKRLLASQCKDSCQGKWSRRVLIKPKSAAVLVAQAAWGGSLQFALLERIFASLAEKNAEAYGSLLHGALCAQWYLTYQWERLPFFWPWCLVGAGRAQCSRLSKRRGMHSGEQGKIPSVLEVCLVMRFCFIQLCNFSTLTLHVCGAVLAAWTKSVT